MQPAHLRELRVLFGTDAYSDRNTTLSDYEEKRVLTTQKSRRALAIALTAMVRDQEITQARAFEIACMVMRENAVALYRLDERRWSRGISRDQLAPVAQSPSAGCSNSGTTLARTAVSRAARRRSR